MFKRFIAALLSTTICTSAVVSSSSFSVGCTSGPDQNKPQTTDYGFQATNSLARYIANQAQESDAQMPSVSQSAESVFEITKIDFDDETGDFCVTSTQSVDCTLQFDIFDEETNKLVISQKLTARSGKYVKTEGSIDVAELPQYYIINTCLLGFGGNRISKEYSNKAHIKVRQEILATDVNDFPAENVVNFDENENTNFIVLNENTVKAEISDTYNQLVSADYDNNVFQIGNADETVKNIENGQYFFFYPNEEDIIAVAVDEVSTDGNITTIKGNDDIGDMFEFIKFETSATTEDTTFDNSETGVGYEYRENPETGECEIAFDPEDVDYIISQEMKEYGASYSGTYSESNSFPDAPFDISAFTFNPTITVSIEVSFNYYDSLTYTELEFSIEKSFSIGISVKTGIERSNSITPSKIPKIPQAKKEIGVLNIPTEIPGIVIIIGLFFEFELSAEMEVSVSFSVATGFTYINDFGTKTYTPSFSVEPCEFSYKVKGTVYVGLCFEIGLAFIDRWVCSIALTLSIGVRVTGEISATIGAGSITGSVTSSNEAPISGSIDINGLYGNINVIGCLDASLDSIHACSTCIDGDIELVGAGGVAITFLGEEKKYTICEISTKLADWYLSFGKLDPDAASIYPVVDDDNWLSSANEQFFEIGLGECPNQAYRVDLDYNGITDNTDYDLEENQNLTHALDDVSLVIQNYKTKQNVDITSIPTYKTYKFYCRDGSYTAILTVGGHVFRKNFTVNGSQKDVHITGAINSNGTLSENTNSSDDDVSSSSVTTTTVTMARVTPITTTKRANPAPRTIEAVQLGDNIIGMLYSNGQLNVQGYGEMYDFNSAPFAKGDTVKEVLFWDRDPENGLVIESIGNHVFDGFSNLNTSTISRDIKPTEDKLFLPKHIKKIGAYAFKDCSSIKEIIIGNELESIAELAFQNCTGITELVIPDSVTAIGRLAFNGCTSLTDLILPFASTDKSYTDLNVEIAPNCSVSDMFIDQYNSWKNENMDFSDYSISNITITGGEVIPSYAFSNMTVLKKVDLSNTSISSIGHYAFWNCNNLAEVKLPKTVTTLGNYSYFGTPITALPDNGAITSAGDYAFGECLNLEKVIVPSSYTSLGEHAFSECTNLTDITVPESVTYMGRLIFNGCTSLANLTMPYAAISKVCTDAEGTIDPNCSVSDMFLDQYNNWENNMMDFSGYSITNITITNGYRIPDYAFSNMTTLKEIDLSKSKIYDINKCAFLNCKNLAVVKLPKTVANIGNYAFYNTAIPTLPDNGKIKSIGDYAFANCSKLTFTTFPESYTTIGFGAFQNCTGIKKLVVPATVTSMERLIFNGCTEMTELTLPYAATKQSCALTGGDIDSNRSVADMFLDQYNNWENGNMEFTPSYHLEKITITGGEIVPLYAFSHMTSVKEIDLSGTEIAAIGKFAFNDCTALEKISLPDSLKTINEYAFRNCTSLPEIKLNDGLNSISEHAFQNCEKFTSIFIPDSVTSMSRLIFNGCTKLEELQLPYAGTVKSCTYSDGENNPNFSVADMFLDQYNNWENNMMNFSNYAIRKITVTGGDKIPSYAFSHMQTLEEVDFSSTAINTIGDYAFWNCSKLATIKIPDTVTSIGNLSYYGTPITKLPDNGHIKTAGNYAFAECHNLGDITIPNSYTSFGSYAFQNCNSIKKLVIPPTVTSMGRMIFNGCTALKELTLPYAATTLNVTQGEANEDPNYSVADLFIDQYNNWENNQMDFSAYSLTKITITGGDIIPKYAFSGMKNLEEIDLSNTKITTIGDHAFNNCINLSNLKFPASLKNINSYAFTNCESMTNFELPSGLRTIGNNAFQNCIGIKTLLIPDSVTSMGLLMLNSCTNLEFLTIPYAGIVRTCTEIDGESSPNYSVADLFINQYNNWENSNMDFSPYKIAKITITGGDKIPKYAFSGMNILKEVNINNSGVELVGDHAFNDCPDLEFIEIPDSVNFIKEGTFTGDSADVYIYNKECDIADKAFDEHYSGTIHGYATSTAKTFAEEKGYKFIPFDGEVIIGPKNITMLTDDKYTVKSDYTELEYASSDNKVATVDENGVISAIAAGKAAISVKASDGKTDTLNVEVNAKPVPVTTSTTAGTTSQTTTTTSTTSNTTTTSNTSTTSTTSITTTSTTSATSTTSNTTTSTTSATSTTSNTTTSNTSTTSTTSNTTTFNTSTTSTTSNTTTSTTSATSTTSSTTTSNTSTTSTTSNTTTSTTSATSTTSNTTTTSNTSTTSTTSNTTTSNTSTTSTTSNTTTSNTSTTSTTSNTNTTSTTSATSTTSQNTEISTTTSTSQILPVTSITVSNGEQYSIPITGSEITFKSSNTDVAVVSKNGVITAVGAGEAVISIIDPDYNVIQLTVTVSKNEISYNLGDVINDGKINAVDASEVLTYYANISTNKEGGFTDTQKLAADVNNDGLVNAVDASCILAYYAYLSTTKEEAKMKIGEYLKQ
ncbi:leucine-rich repeat protein [Ruminococcus sp.]|uniref:leucine-rich repeat protein n=1 Tax=Ruminococcus sp. TaxID=41978 RepID=UPI0025CDABF7|nr:leucine-rich repeat protein [Ruminococcus sp.]MCR4638496.1 leucine-rich repeat protein [Ruminococcus sp.]